MTRAVLILSRNLPLRLAASTIDPSSREFDFCPHLRILSSPSPIGTHLRILHVIARWVSTA